MTTITVRVPRGKAQVLRARGFRAASLLGADPRAYAAQRRAAPSPLRLDITMIALLAMGAREVPA
jgi:hypothetical protein